MVYDPTSDLLDAYNNNYAQMNQIDANGVSTVWLGLRYREGIGTVPHYSYGKDIPKTYKHPDSQMHPRSQHCH